MSSHLCSESTKLLHVSAFANRESAALHTCCCHGRQAVTDTQPVTGQAVSVSADWRANRFREV